MAFTELRVHGMSGTPPRDLLYSDPVAYDRSDPFARIYEGNRDGREVKAFHWGSLTSGSRATAFWLLLSPFMLANLAGWMASTKPWVQAFIRLAGLFISGLLVAQGAVVLISHVNEIVAGQAYQATAVAGGALILALLYLTILWRLSTQSLLEPMSKREKLLLLMGIGEKSLEPPRMTEEERSLQTRDPAPGATLADPRMWNRQSILNRLRRQHLAGGVVMIPIALELGLGGQLILGAGLAVTARVVLDVAVSARSGPAADFIRRLSSADVHLAFALFVASMVRVLLVDLPEGAWPHIHQMVLYVSILAGAASLGTLISQLLARHGHWMHSFLPLSALAIGATVGGALGVAAGLFAELASYRFLGDLNPFQVNATFDIEKTAIMQNGGAWTVESMLCFFLALIGFAAIAGWNGDTDIGALTRGKEMGVARWVTSKAARVFGATGVIASVLAPPALYISCFAGDSPGCDPTVLADPTFEKVVPTFAGIVAAFTVIALTVALRRINLLYSLATLVAGALAIWLVWDERFNDFTWTLPVIHLPVRPARFLDLSVVIIVFGLTFLIVRSIVGGFGDPEKRRKVGMLWDTGSFWPRWFHPLAPPAYSPHAVKSLNGALASEGSEILAAHSQGSVISCVALSQPGAPLPRGLVTYGSPLGILYDRLFPLVGVQALIEQVDRRWGDRSHWINLWRDTDPLGGACLPGMSGNRKVTAGTGHSQYELSDEFFNARRDAIAGYERGPWEEQDGCGPADRDPSGREEPDL